MMYAPNSAGMRSVAIQNALVRMRSTYSRRMMAKVFFQFMRASFDRSRFFHAGRVHRFDVDLFEIRLLLRERLDGERVHRVPHEIFLAHARCQADDEAAVRGL